MNERIEELYRQSFMEVKDENSFPCMTFSKQRFAELIVRECASIYDKIDNGNKHLGTEDYLEALQKHFGVE